VSVVLLVSATLLIGWGLYAVCRPKPIFIVRITDGVPRISRGQVTRGFLQDIADACDRHGIRNGEIQGLAVRRRINLIFSRQIPISCQQQVRNLWSLSGWSGR
jgi:hypothetical protein